jgi:hypothetical protein
VPVGEGAFVAGATTLKDAEAWPPVGRVALITYEPAELGAANVVEKAPPDPVETVFDPVGLLTLMFTLLGKYDP